MSRTLRIAQVVPPLERVPPLAYGGTERVVYELLVELERRGHEVTTFGSGDSQVPGRLVPTVAKALRPAGFGGDPMGWFVATQLKVLEHQDEFDIVHSHLEQPSLVLARAARVPVVSTFHGRLDFDYYKPAFANRPSGLVAISKSQAAVHPEVPWAAVVYNGLTLDQAPFERRRSDDLVFVGRVAPEKGVVDAIEVARISGRKLHIAAKVGKRQKEIDYFDSVFKPAMATADVEFHGELEAHDRDRLVASAYASLLPANWPEPFGLVSIESLACGTPVIAHRVGATPEIVREGIDGFFGDDAQHMAYLLDRVEGLDRAAIRKSVLERFSAGRMVDAYLDVYEAAIAGQLPTAPAGADRAEVVGRDARERTLERSAERAPEAASPERVAPSPVPTAGPNGSHDGHGEADLRQRELPSVLGGR